MQIDILYVEGCPNHAPTVALVKQIVADMSLTVSVREVQMTTPEEAQQWGFLGSPTVFVNGVDIDPNARQQASYGLSCRIYPGGSGLPPDEMIRAALQSPPYRHNAEGDVMQAHQMYDEILELIYKRALKRCARTRDPWRPCERNGLWRPLTRERSPEESRIAGLKRPQTPSAG